MSSLECPYCEKEIDDPDDMYDPCKNYELECPHCEKSFVFEVEYERYYSASKADCLNGAEHKYSITKTYPKRYAKMRCEMCQDEKPLPKEMLNEIIAEEGLTND